MAEPVQRIKVTNDRERFVTLWLEPWGEDYGISPGDELELIATGIGEDFYFHILYGDKGVKVYVEGELSGVGVFQNEELLSCGHKRREEEW